MFLTFRKHSEDIPKHSEHIFDNWGRTIFGASVKKVNRFSVKKRNHVHIDVQNYSYYFYFLPSLSNDFTVEIDQ